MKFLVFVEGKTERNSIAEFLKRWFDPRLTEPVAITPIQFKGFGHYLKDVRERVEYQLTSPKQNEIIAIIGLLDMYGLDIFPQGLSYAEKVTWGRQYLENHVGSPRFKQYFAIHELEAWLLGDPAILPTPVRTSLPNRCRQPEAVNLNEPPSLLLDRLYRARLRKSYRKTIDGSNLFLRCSPSTVAGCCPYFAQMLNELRTLAEEVLRHRALRS